MSSWRLAESLSVLRAQVNKAYPDRDKSSDGTIGDRPHASRRSDHNPNSRGVVTAMDITRDDDTFSAEDFVERLRTSGDRRVKYLIFNRRIAEASRGMKWRKYTGSNPHNKHFHVSVSSDPILYDNKKKWSVLPSTSLVTTARAVGLTTAAGTTTASVVSEVVGPIQENIQTVKEVVDTSGQVIEVTTTAVSIVPESVWGKALAFVTTPGFLGVALGVTLLAWLVTFVVRKRRGI